MNESTDFADYTDSKTIEGDFNVGRFLDALSFRICEICAICGFENLKPTAGSLCWVRIWAFAEIASRALSTPSVVRPLTYDLRDASGRA
jgi:hypothetical protein